MGGFKLSQQTPAAAPRSKAAPVATESQATDVSTRQPQPPADQLRDTQRALKRTREHLRLQETRSRQLVAACAAKLRERQADAERQQQLKDSQFQRILQQLAVLQSRLQREQKLVTARLSEQQQLTQQQARDLERLRRANRRLLGKVTRLSAPCARCGTKPDSGISDCDEEETASGGESRPKLAKTTPTAAVSEKRTPIAGSTAAAAAAAGGSPDSALASSETSSDSASPPTAERGIMKTSRGHKSAHKTVTFSLQDKENDQPDSADSGDGSASRPERRARPPLPLKPRLILPPSAHVNGTTMAQPSIVDTISQLLGVDLEAAAATRRPAPAPLSAIPELLETSRNGGGAKDKSPEATPPSGGVANVTDSGGDGRDDAPETDEPAPDHPERPRNAPRSRSNINLIMSEREGVRIKNNFEEFKFEEDMTSSVCSEDTVTSDSGGGGSGGCRLATERPAGDGAEEPPAGPPPPPPPARPAYDRFLEQSGLSQKSIRTPKRLFTNHRSMLKPSDVKHRHRSKTAFDGFAIEDISPTSVRYYSEEL